MDIGEIIKAPIQDADWWKKCLLMGLITLIPIVGLLNLLGYVTACFHARRNGEAVLPDANLSYIGPGWWLFVACLPVVGLFVLLMIMMAVGMGVAAHVARALTGVIALLGNLVIFVLALAVWAATPAIFYLHLVKGERWASAKVGDIIELIKQKPNAYLMFWLTFLVAGVLGSLGQIACGVGLLLSLPFGYAMQGIAIAEFAKEMESADGSPS